MALTNHAGELVQIGIGNGRSVVEKSSPLTRLNYFDGKFLRAPDMQAEQNALRRQVHLANQAGGGGIVHGFDCALSNGDDLVVSNGLAFDWQGARCGCRNH